MHCSRPQAPRPELSGTCLWPEWVQAMTVWRWGVNYVPMSVSLKSTAEARTGLHDKDAYHWWIPKHVFYCFFFLPSSTYPSTMERTAERLVRRHGCLLTGIPFFFEWTSSKNCQLFKRRTLIAKWWYCAALVTQIWISNLKSQAKDATRVTNVVLSILPKIF